MQEMNHWRMDRPDEDVADEVEGGELTHAENMAGLPVRTYLPDSLVPGYPYPLLVMFHERGGNEEQVLRHVPRISSQNFVYLSLRGPEPLGRRADGKRGFGWAHRNAGLLSEYVELAVSLVRQTVQIHSERVYLVGVNEGADAAYRAGFALAGKVAGVIALNGTMPQPTLGKPVFRFDDARKLRVFMGHGVSNSEAIRRQTDKDYKVLYGCGADVQYQTYPTDQDLHAEMFRDVNRWIVGNVNAEHDMYAVRD